MLSSAYGPFKLTKFRSVFVEFAGGDLWREPE